MKRAGVIRPKTAANLILLVLLVALAFWWWDFDATNPAFGRFEGKVSGTWGDDGRNMTLDRDFAYLDPSGKRWAAPTGSLINGASIPKVFWSVIGGPFEGRFRNASVLHDAACGEQKEDWREVHRMFYNAMRCGQVGEGKAQTMYWAVYHFGPRWAQPGEGEMAFSVVEPEPEVAEKAARYFERKDLTLKEIEECSVEDIETEVARWDAAKENP